MIWPISACCFYSLYESETRTDINFVKCLRISNSNCTVMFHFTVMSSVKSLFDCRNWHFLGEPSIPWGSHYFLVNNKWTSCFPLVYYDWKSYFFAGVNIHRCLLNINSFEAFCGEKRLDQELINSSKRKFICTVKRC